MSGPVIRDIIRDYMSEQFRKNETTEFTVGDIARGLQGQGHNVTSKQIANGLQSLKALNKTVQTRKVPGGSGNAMYWALVKVLEIATEPTKPDNESANEEQVEMPHTDEQSDGDRKPRHDDIAHVVHSLDRRFADFEERMMVELSRMLGDTEKALKAQLASIKEAVTAAPSANKVDTFNWGKLAQTLETDRQKMYEDAVKRVTDQHVMSFADIGAKLSEENTGHMHKVIDIAQDFVTGYDNTIRVLYQVLEKAVGEDDVKEKGFTKGFTAGFSAAVKQVRGEVAQLLSKREENRLDTFGVLIEHGPTGNSAAVGIPEQTQEKPIEDHPLRETLRKLGARGSRD